MVNIDQASQLGGLLRLPDLEAETKVLINQKLRDLIEPIKPPQPLTEAQQQEMQSIMQEYLYGAAKKEGEQ